MVTALALADLALLAAAATAIALAVRRPAYTPVAVYLGGLALGDAVRRYMAEGVLAVPGPYEGSTRAAFHLEEALFVGSLFGFAALAAVVFHSAIPGRAIGVAYVVAVAALVASYPDLRGRPLARVYLADELGALAVSAAAVVQWGWRLERPRLEHGAVLAVVGVEIAKVAGGPWRVELGAGWWRAWPMHAVVYGSLAVVQMVVRGGGSWNTR